MRAVGYKCNQTIMATSLYFLDHCLPCFVYLLSTGSSNERLALPPVGRVLFKPIKYHKHPYPDKSSIVMSLAVWTAIFFTTLTKIAKHKKNKFAAVLQIEFREKPTQMCADGRHRYAQFRGNLFIRAAREDTFGYIGLSWR